MIYFVQTFRKWDGKYRYTPKTILRASTVFVVTTIVILYSFILLSPKSVINALKVRQSELLCGSISIAGISGVSTDLEGDELSAFLELLKNTVIQFDGADPRITVPIGTIKYMMIFQERNGNTIKAIISDNGYLYYNGYKYKILSNENITLLQFCEACVFNYV